jgi:hypothetical protein
LPRTTHGPGEGGSCESGGAGSLSRSLGVESIARPRSRRLFPGLGHSARVYYESRMTERSHGRRNERSSEKSRPKRLSSEGGASPESQRGGRANTNGGGLPKARTLFPTPGAGHGDHLLRRSRVRDHAGRTQGLWRGRVPIRCHRDAHARPDRLLATPAWPVAAHVPRRALASWCRWSSRQSVWTRPVNAR